MPRPPQGQLVVLGRPGAVPEEQLDVALVDGPDVTAVRAAARAVTAPRVLAEIEVALDTPEATGAERVAALERHAARPDHGRLRHIGPAAELVALIADLADNVDGVRLRPLVLDEDLPVLSRLVLPDLFDRRVAARPLPGTTLRSTLGLERPANRFAAAGTREENR
ncbi:hypothetical protein [Streptomyces sp. NPDC091217]|uniref:hypothetical protein n=1 Tax=Streptomyces sp. NPDC091217 TaxID=3365975 RepID=UPI00381652D9